MGNDPMNVLYERMLPFHRHFRHDIALLKRGIDGTSTATRNTLLSYIQTGTDLTRHLEGHHRIEEAIWFPRLAPKLPQFSTTHLQEHQAMHRELEVFSDSLRKARSALGKQKANMPPEGGWPSNIWDQEAMKATLLRLEGELLPHLEAEENSIKADSLRKAGFTVDELRYFV